MWVVSLLVVAVFLSLVFTRRRGAGTRSPLLASVPPCAASEVDLLPYEDPRRSSRLSREMNYNCERHCPTCGEALACLMKEREEGEGMKGIRRSKVFGPFFLRNTSKGVSSGVFR